MNKKDIKRSIFSYVFALAVLICLYYAFVSFRNVNNQLSYDEFMSNLNKGTIEKLEITPSMSGQVYILQGKLKDYKDNEMFTLKAPLSEKVISDILSASESDNFKLKVNKDPEGSSFLLMLLNFLPYALIIGVTLFFLNKQVGGANKSFDFGKSKAKLQTDKNKVTFDNVAGLVEEKQEVKELIDFLKNPRKFQKLGARIPKGVLLVGPPGTGKTLLAKAVAGEANVPFYYISGSDFVELFVGVGASRVRDMFKQAKQTAPCLIFIDEIDAVGRQRGTGLGGGHDEREQTLNQLLTEMDGFGANEGIIIIAATNRPDVLDPALLRPGRFDRQVTVSLPDVREREAILKVHAKNKILGKDVNLKFLAKRTSGFSGADLENLLNEAALLAVRKNKSEINMSDVDEAHDRVLMGPAKTTRQPSEKDKKITAYHEAGHVVAGLKQENSNIVQKVTIIPRGMAGGYTNIQNEEEKFHVTKKELLETITTLLAGRGSEELMFKDITTGASNDIERATQSARSMVTVYGMTERFDMMALESIQNRYLDGRAVRNCSEETSTLVDEEILKIIRQCHNKAIELLTENRDLLDEISEYLLEKETIFGTDFERFIYNKYPELKKIKEKEKEENKLDLEKEENNDDHEAKEENYENHEDKENEVASTIDMIIE